MLRATRLTLQLHGARRGPVPRPRRPRGQGAARRFHRAASQAFTGISSASSEPRTSSSARCARHRPQPLRPAAPPTTAPGTQAHPLLGPLGGEERLCLRLRERGWKIWRLVTAMALHDANLIRYGQWWRRTARGGNAYAEVSQHSSSPLRIWRKETLRAVCWAGILPAAILVCGLLKNHAFAALLLYPAQVVRLAVRRDVRRTESWTFATFMMLAKFAELQGIIRYYWSALKKRFCAVQRTKCHNRIWQKRALNSR